MSQNLDRTYCSHSRNCANTACDRNLDQVTARYATMMGRPIAQANLLTATCGFLPKDTSHGQT